MSNGNITMNIAQNITMITNITYQMSLNGTLNMTEYELPWEYEYNWYLLVVSLTCSLSGSFSVFSLMYMIKYACEMKIIVICLIAIFAALPI